MSADYDPSEKVKKVLQAYSNRNNLHIGWDVFAEMSKELGVDSKEDALRIFISVLREWRENRSSDLPCLVPYSAYSTIFQTVINKNAWQDFPTTTVVKNLCDGTFVADVSHIEKRGLETVWTEIVHTLKGLVARGKSCEEAYLQILAWRRPKLKNGMLAKILQLEPLKQPRDLLSFEAEKRRLDAGLTCFASGVRPEVIYIHYKVRYYNMLISGITTRLKTPFTIKFQDHLQILLNYLEAEKDFTELPRSGFLNHVIMYIRSKDPTWIPPYSLKDKVTRVTLRRVFVEGNNDNFIDNSSSSNVKTTEFIDDDDDDSDEIPTVNLLEDEQEEESENEANE